MTAIAILFALDWVGHKQEQEIPAKASDNDTPKQPEPSFYLECNFGGMPRKFPPSGRIPIYELLPQAHELGGISSGFMFGQPGADIGISDNPDLNWAYECRATNDGTSPAFDVTLPVTTVFRKGNRVPNQPKAFQSGEIIAVKKTSVIIPRLDPGRENSFVFYLKSQNKNFADVTFGDKVTMRGNKSGSLIHSEMMRVSFSPFVLD